MKKLTIHIAKQKQRVTWGFNPVTRVKPSKKVYSRKKFNKKNLLDRI